MNIFFKNVDVHNLKIRTSSFSVVKMLILRIIVLKIGFTNIQNGNNIGSNINYT